MLTVDQESSQKLIKKFYRRTALFTWLWCAAILNAVEDRGGHDWVSRPFFLTQGEPVAMPCRLFCHPSQVSQ